MERIYTTRRRIIFSVLFFVLLIITSLTYDPHFMTSAFTEVCYLCTERDDSGSGLNFAISFSVLALLTFIGPMSLIVGSWIIKKIKVLKNEMLALQVAFIIGVLLLSLLMFRRNLLGITHISSTLVSLFFLLVSVGIINGIRQNLKELQGHNFDSEVGLKLYGGIFILVLLESTYLLGSSIFHMLKYYEFV